MLKRSFRLTQVFNDRGSDWTAGVGGPCSSHGSAECAVGPMQCHAERGRADRAMTFGDPDPAGQVSRTAGGGSGCGGLCCAVLTAREVR